MMMVEHRDLPVAARLSWPLESYTVKGYRFGQRVRSRVILWARHLGDDILTKAGTSIVAIGDGKVVWSEVRPGSSEHRNWGGIVIVGHRHPHTDQSFYSVYGHLRELTVKENDIVQLGQHLGVIAAGNTPENGWWKIPHLHFGIYMGPWMDQVLPGYVRPLEGRTRLSWWRDPRVFIEQYVPQRNTVAADPASKNT
ncbi:MAG: M23 family metallopeptidase [Acidobacteriota bacterium]